MSIEPVMTSRPLYTDISPPDMPAPVAKVLWKYPQFVRSLPYHSTENVMLSVQLLWPRARRLGRELLGPVDGPLRDAFGIYYGVWGDETELPYATLPLSIWNLDPSSQHVYANELSEFVRGRHLMDPASASPEIILNHTRSVQAAYGYAVSSIAVQNLSQLHLPATPPSLESSARRYMLLQDRQHWHNEVMDGGGGVGIDHSGSGGANKQGGGGSSAGDTLDNSLNIPQLLPDPTSIPAFPALPTFPPFDATNSTISDSRSGVLPLHQSTHSCAAGLDSVPEAVIDNQALSPEKNEKLATRGNIDSFWVDNSLFERGSTISVEMPRERARERSDGRKSYEYEEEVSSMGIAGRIDEIDMFHDDVGEESAASLDTQVPSPTDVIEASLSMFDAQLEVFPASRLTSTPRARQRTRPGSRPIFARHTPSSTNRRLSSSTSSHHHHSSSLSRNDRHTPQSFHPTLHSTQPDSSTTPMSPLAEGELRQFDLVDNERCSWCIKRLIKVCSVRLGYLLLGMDGKEERTLTLIRCHTCERTREGCSLKGEGALPNWVLEQLGMASIASEGEEEWEDFNEDWKQEDCYFVADTIRQSIAKMEADLRRGGGGSGKHGQAKREKAEKLRTWRIEFERWINLNTKFLKGRPLGI